MNAGRWILALLLLTVMVLPLLVACGERYGEAETTAGESQTEGPETLPPVVTGEIMNDKQEFELKSGDSVMRLRVDGNEVTMTYLATKNSAVNHALDEDAMPMSLPSSYSLGASRSARFAWSYVGYLNYRPEGAKYDEYGYIFRFRDEKAKMEYDLFVTTHFGFDGPFEFTGYLYNRSEEAIKVSPAAYFRTSACGEKAPTMWYFNKESGAAEGITLYDGRLFSGSGIYKVNLSGASPLTITCNTNQDHNSGGQIPMMYADYETWGLYCALEWTNGQIIATESDKTGSCNMLVKLGSGSFDTTVPAGESLYLPTVYYGVYDGDVDDGSNVFKRWFLYNKSPEILLEDENEPLVQQDMQIGLSAADYGIEAIKWDYGWWSDTPQGAWKTNEGLLEVHNSAYLGVMNGVGASTLSEFVNQVKAKGMTLTTYILLKDTMLNRKGVPTSVGRHGKPEWFSNRNVTGVGRSADLGNTDCVAFFKDYLLNFFKETGVTTWRSDFEPICRESDKSNRHAANGNDVQYWCSVGFYDLVDYLYENLDYFRYESCCSGGAMKDFSTMRRAVIINCDDSANYQSLKMSFYDSSYCFPAAQIQLPTNAGSYTAGRPYYVGFADHDYGLRSQLVGAAMLSNWDGTQKADKESWERLLPTYKEKIRPLMKYGNLYHVLERPDGKNWDGLFYVDLASSNDTKGVLMIFKPTKQAGDTKVVKLRGLEPGVSYRVEFDAHPEQNTVMTGAQLMNEGLSVTFTKNTDSDWVFIVQS